MKFRINVVVAMLLAMAAATRGSSAEVEREPLAVKTQRVEFVEYTPQLSVTGDVEARYHNDLAFRVSGRVSERLVDIGDHVAKGQVLAKLAPEEKQADLEAAKANVSSIEATLRQASLTLKRQKALLDKGFTTLSDHDSAQEAYRVATGNLDAAEARLSEAQQSLDDTILRSEESGVITQRSVEVGQVVQPGSTVFSIASDGPRDAVLKVFEALLANRLATPEFHIHLVSDPSVEAVARMREISPTVDPATGTVKLKLSIDNPPASMTLGAPVTVVANLIGQRVAMLPWSSLASLDGKPAVWIVDPETDTVDLHLVQIARHETERVLISDGLADGEVVVTFGTQLLSPKQMVNPREGDAL
ncbi:efflux RND transporter periplasmic adaptor subunit [Roseibium algae]|uniref:Efflux RND transporter periplasmic adaptor subunit n=1 Tax=Roseibium algae TaxID=3123038 RepID=A0ABU8TLM0_9HYPH